MDQLYKDKEWLKNKLESIGNLKQIGDLCGVSGDTIEYWRKKHNLPKAQKGLQVNRKQTINHNYFEEINTAEKAYWLGFIMADGTISSNGKYYSRLEINLKKNDDEFELLQQFNKALQSSYEIKEILVKNKKRNCESWIFNLRINSKKMVSDLMKHGIVPKKTGKEYIPDTIPDQFVKDFIRGFFDGDGTIKKDGRVGFCSSSKLILNQINDHIKHLDIQFTIYENDYYNIPFYVFESSKKDRNKRFLDYIYKDSSIYLKRKYLRYIDLYSSPIEKSIEKNSEN